MKEKLNREDLIKIFKDSRISQTTSDLLHSRLKVDKSNMEHIRKKLTAKLINKTKRGRMDVYKNLKFQKSDIEKIEKLMVTVARMKKIGLSEAEKRRNIKESRASARTGRVMGVAGGGIISSGGDSMQNITKQMLKF